MPPLPREEYKDLGFGSVLGSEHGRLLNRDGTFNVVRRGLGPFGALNIYHHLLTVSWPAFLGLVAAGYAVTNALFAVLYTLCGPDALRGTDGIERGSRFLTGFFFSVETLATIGFGNIAPNGLAANVLMTVESLVGLLAFALASGLVFARFARPVARIVFSENALIAPYHGYTAFMFRVVNGRSNQLIEVNAKVSVSLGHDGSRRFHELTLERPNVTLFTLSWTIVHPIDESSPLWGITERELHQEDAEFFVVMEAIDETFSQAVHARTSYKPQEVVWGARFRDLFIRSEGHVRGIDVSRLHDFAPAELPQPAHARDEEPSIV